MRPHVVVLNWDGLEDTRACLRSLQAQDPPPGEVWLVDNGSPGGQAGVLAREFPWCRHLALPVNLGFTGGVNRALEAILAEGRAEWVALLNNDAEADPGWLAALAARAEGEPRAGLVASLMVRHDRPGTVENAGVAILPTGDAVPRGRGDPRERFRSPCDLLAACGVAVLLRAAMLRETGLLREDFFASFEDVDLSLRARLLGWRCLYAPAAVVRHRLGRSVDRLRSREFFLRSQRNQAWALLVNLPGPALAALLPFLLLREAALLLAAMLAGRDEVAAALVASRRRLWRERRALSAARRELQARRRAGAWAFLGGLGWNLALHYGPLLREAAARGGRFFAHSAGGRRGAGAGR